MSRVPPLAALLALALLATAPALTQSPRLHTSRPTGKQLLQLPKEEDAFGFVVFGDRTGGPVAGIEVLAQAVRDANLLDPDLVFTVGDMVNGYNDDPKWLAQAAEFKATMAGLHMPWFPVAGNHDIYWRGEGRRPAEEHEDEYEAHFGPLWYAVQHKQCWFLALYSDEPDPATGERNFNKPACQQMSEAQFAWLDATLTRAKDARHVFVFLHHPRWLKGRYGDAWDRVHARLVANGNVTAVFAGHIHSMRYDGVVDGIAYYTIATVGAHLDMDAPQAGFLHEYHVVTVRPEGIVTGALPVGAVIDPQQITGQVNDDVVRLRRTLQPTVTGWTASGDGQPIGLDGAADGVLLLSFPNEATRPIELEVVPMTPRAWRTSPDHQHVVVPPGGTATTTFRLVRPAARGAAPGPFALPRVQVRCDYLAEHGRIGLTVREHDLDLPAPEGLGALAQAAGGVLVLDGTSACLELASARLAVPDGPLTVELWLCGDDFAGRRAVLAKTENSEFCLFCSNGAPEFSVLLGEGYATARSAEVRLEKGRWHHFAGVYDGAEVRCYVDGRLVAQRAASGRRKTNALPLFVGADPNGSGRPTSFFDGRVDEVRISTTARYVGATFTPPRRHAPDDATALLLHLDADFGIWTPDSSPAGAHPRRRGAAYCTVESKPKIR